MGPQCLLSSTGPVVRELDINCRNNLFGPGNRANSTIGRAMRLVLMNACAAIPGLFDRSVLGIQASSAFASPKTSRGFTGTRCTWSEALPWTRAQ